MTNWLCPPNRAYLIKLIVTSGEIQLPCELTKLAKEEDQLTHGYIDVVRVDAQVGMQTIGGLLQPFAIG